MGTVVWRMDGEKKSLVGELLQEGQKLVVASGGAGGWGNSRFVTSTYQAPRIAQRGQASEQVRLMVELKLLADVGILGLPNAGKSTLLRVMSAARPKVADYPFTTLEPVLGVVEVGWERFVAADMPGLIEGAHSGSGLGLEFLRHIERTSVLLHLLDGSRPDPLADMEVVNAEIAAYGEELRARPQVVGVNKVDLRGVRRRSEGIREALADCGIEAMFVSAATGEGVDELKRALLAAVQNARLAVVEVEPATLRPRPRPRFMLSREDGGFRVESEGMVTFAEMMPLEMEEARAEMWRRLSRWGVVRALKRAGARPGDRVRLGAVELEWEG